MKVFKKSILNGIGGGKIFEIKELESYLNHVSE
jgi:hypothetical protein